MNYETNFVFQSTQENLIEVEPKKIEEIQDIINYLLRLTRESNLKNEFVIKAILGEEDDSELTPYRKMLRKILDNYIGNINHNNLYLIVAEFVQMDFIEAFPVHPQKVTRADSFATTILSRALSDPEYRESRFMYDANLIIMHRLVKDLFSDLLWEAELFDDQRVPSMLMHWLDCGQDIVIDGISLLPGQIEPEVQEIRTTAIFNES